ncbi:MAG: hypothetical protein WBE18_02530, partial [Gammaproteobacteria bacterium]
LKKTGTDDIKNALSNLPVSIDWFKTQLKLLYDGKYQHSKTIFKKILKKFLTNAGRAEYPTSSEQNLQILNQFIAELKAKINKKTPLFFKRSVGFLENEKEKTEFLAWLENLSTSQLQTSPPPSPRETSSSISI